MVEQTPRRILPVVIGLALTGILLALLAYAAHRRNQQQSAVPALAIVAPLPESAVDSPLVVIFTSTQPLELSAGGWGYHGLHLHMSLNDVSLMPAAADITPTAARTYQWLIPAVRRGSVTVSLGWADAAHRPLVAGMSEVVTMVVR